MSQLNINYPTMEIAICLVDFAPLVSGHERGLVGDIIAVRKPHYGIGTKELDGFMWLRVEGLEEAEFSKLTNAISSHDKRRYCIPLEKLFELDPNFDIDLAKQSGSNYQPFLFVDDESDYSFILEQYKPFNVFGLIYDKVTGDYI